MQNNTSLISKPTNWTNMMLLYDKIMRDFFAHRIGIIQSYDPASNTCTVVIVDKDSILSDENTITYEDIPPLPNIPIFRYATQNAGVTKPILIGDTVMLLFNDTNIDNFLQNPSVQPPLLDYIRHDINNAIAIPFDFTAWEHNNAGTELFYGNIKISLSGGNITFTTQNSQQIVIDANGNMTIAGNLTVTGGTVNIGSATLQAAGSKLLLGGQEIAVVGGVTNGSATTQTITTSGQ